MGVNGRRSNPKFSASSKTQIASLTLCGYRLNVPEAGKINLA